MKAILIRDFLKQRLTLFLLALVVVGCGLRIWRYEYYPVAGETQDEVAWTILGSSLLQTGRPVSWSYFSGYEVLETITFQGNKFQLVSPALDHPPLFSFLPGVAQSLAGHNWKEIPSIKLVRFPIVLLSMVNLIIFAWWIMRSVKDPVHRLVSIGIAATAPNIVFLSRLVVSENLLVTWMLMILLLNTTVLVGWKKWLWMLAHAASPLTKIAGLALSVGSLASNFFLKQKNAFRWGVIGLALGVVVGLAYAAIYDFSLFVEIQTQQAARDTGLLTLFSSWWWANTLVEGLFADIWNQIGLLSLVLLAFGTQFQKENKTVNLVLFLFISQLAFYLLSVGETTVHGWYRIVFWPLWAYSIGWIVALAWEKKNSWVLSLSWIFLAAQFRLGLIFLLGKQAFAWQATISKLWLGLAGVSLLTVFVPAKHRNNTQKGWWILLGLLLLLAHLATIMLINHELTWQDALYLEQGIQP